MSMRLAKCAECQCLQNHTVIEEANKLYCSVCGTEQPIPVEEDAANGTNKGKKTMKKNLTKEQRVEIVAKHSDGMSTKDLAEQYGKSEQTINIVIKAFKVAKAAVSKHKPTKSCNLKELLTNKFPANKAQAELEKRIHALITELVEVKVSERMVEVKTKISVAMGE